MPCVLQIKLHRVAACLLAGIALVLAIPAQLALGAKGASIRLPDEFAARSVRIPFTGFSGYNRGNYRGGEIQGEFTRIESRLGVFDPLYVANRGKSSFTIEQPAGTVQVSADCQAIERTATVRFVTLDLEKLVYSCEIQGLDLGSDTRFVLGEPKREGFKEKLLARDRRIGEASVLGQEFVFESVHEYRDSKLNSQTPLGYLIHSDGELVAAVDLLDWSPIVHFKLESNEMERRATAIVALALAVLRDPANSALEEL